METTVTTLGPVVSTTSTLIGPNGTAPGLAFIEQQSKPLEDSSGERAAALVGKSQGASLGAEGRIRILTAGS